MASLGRSFRRVAFPCTTELPTPATKLPKRIPAFDEPVNGPMDTDGLKKRINWSKKMQMYRNISPRFKIVVDQFKANCENLGLMKTQKHSWKRPFVEEKRKSLEDNIIALDASLQSCWIHQEGPEGLCRMVEDTIEAMMEIRMVAEYGDYLALHCEILNQGDMNDMLWKRTEGCDWQVVAEKLADEERILALARSSQSAIPATPWLDDVHTAALRKNPNFEQTVFEIQSYAQRNAFSHTGVGKYVNQGQWETLAKRIAYDKSILPKVIKNRVDQGITMRLAIGKCEHEWFDYIYDDDGIVRWFPSQKASEKSRALMNRARDKAKKAARQDAAP